jgi:uncharacterized protein YutE (UPF0331/DUF86 family)
MNKLHLDVLREKINKLNLSAEWVSRSYEQAKTIKKENNYTPEEFEKLEVLASRYTRTTDMLVNKALRSIDTLESEDIGTIIDIMNRAEKRGIVESAELLHTIKDLRNNIVHEYQIDEIAKFFGDIIKYSPVLLMMIKKLNEYCAKYLGKETVS